MPDPKTQTEEPQAKPQPESQSAEISEMLDGLDQDIETQAAAEEPPVQEPKGQPDPELKEPAAGTKPAEEPGQEPGTKAESPAADATAKPPAEPKPAAEPPSVFETTVEVKMPDGARQVKVADLCTTYMQFEHLQRQHQVLKPFIELSRQGNIDLNQVYQFTLYGIKAAAESAQREQGGNGQQPAGYHGPFEDAETDAYIKEADPKLHQALWRNFKLIDEMQASIRKSQAQPATTVAQPAQPPGSDEQAARVSKVMDTFVSVHKGYFGANPTAMPAFKGYVGRLFGHLPVESFNEALLNSAMAGFDPAYHARFSATTLKNQPAKPGKDTGSAFGETDQVVHQGGLKPPYTDQQKEIVELLEYEGI